MIRMGLQIPWFTFPDVPDHALFARVSGIAGAAEAAGFDSIWVMDHFYSMTAGGRPPSDPMPEAYTLLGALAARTERARLGALVTGVTYRNPALLAKQVTTLDLVSSGRAVLGIGAAWYAQEHAGYGFDFPPIKERMDRLDEAVRICRAMFTREAPSFAGRHYRIEQALNYPRPVQRGGIPIMVGGSGERRLLRIVAEHADIWNFHGGVPLSGVPEKLRVLEEHCARVGRNRVSITATALRTLVVAPTQAAAEAKAAPVREAFRLDEANFRDRYLCGSPATVAEQVQAYLEAGVDGMIVNLPDAYDLETVALAGEALRPALESGAAGG